MTYPNYTTHPTNKNPKSPTTPRIQKSKTARAQNHITPTKYAIIYLWKTSSTT